MAPGVGLTYTLGRSLYVPLTCRSNSVTLPATRGPGFSLPADAVSALLRLRVAEGYESAAEPFNLPGDRAFLPPSLPSIFSLPTPVDSVTNELGDRNDGLDPSIETLVASVEEQLLAGGQPATDGSSKGNKKTYRSVVIAGEGEPTLRLSALLAVARAAASSMHALPVRVVTNGLGGAIPNQRRVLPKMREAGVTSVSISLMTSQPDQYGELMGPVLHPAFIEASLMAGTGDLEVSMLAHGIVCDFVSEALGCGMEVEVTGVDRPDVDKDKAEHFAANLGVRQPFRWRPYFS